MLKSYRISKLNENAKTLAKKVTELLVNNSVTYQEARVRPVCALAVNKGRLGGKEH